MNRKIQVMLFTTELQIGGVQLKLLHIARNLNKRKFDVHVVSNGVGALIEEFEHIPGVTTHVVKGLVKRPDPIKDVLALIRLCRLLAAVKPDIIDYTGIKAAGLGALASWGMRLRVRIYTMGGMIFNDQQSPLIRFVFKSVERMLCALSTVVINVCRTNRDKLLSNRIVDPRKTEVVYSPSDLEAFVKAGEQDRKSLREELGWDPQTFIVLQVTNLLPAKNPIALLQAAEGVVPCCPNARFYIAGNGPDWAKLEKFIFERGLERNCFLLGWRKDIPKLMGAADVVTLTTKYQEGLPQVCAQAMAAGKPLIMYDWEGVSEELIDGQNGYLVPVDDVRGLTERLVELYGDLSKVQAMGQASRRLLNREHEVGVMVENMEKIYLKMCSIK